MYLNYKIQIRTVEKKILDKENKIKEKSVLFRENNIAILLLVLKQ